MPQMKELVLVEIINVMNTKEPTTSRNLRLKNQGGNTRAIIFLIDVRHATHDPPLETCTFMLKSRI